MATLVTAVTQRTLPAVRVLSGTYLRHHPQAHVFALVIDPWLECRNESFTALYPDDVANLPERLKHGLDAVKPLVLKHLLASQARLVWLDPLTQVFSRMTALEDALHVYDVVLLPDPATVYSTRCVAMKRSQTAHDVLAFWAERAPQALHVASVPALFSSVGVLQHPGFNVNHHTIEARTLSPDLCVDAKPLVTLDVRHGQRLCRGATQEHPLGVVCRDYQTQWRAAALGATTHLANGVPFTDAMQRTALRCMRRQLTMPNIDDADAFCRFLLTPNERLDGVALPPLVSTVLRQSAPVRVTLPRWRELPARALAWFLAQAQPAHTPLLERFGGALQHTNVLLHAETVLNNRAWWRGRYTARFFPSSMARLRRFLGRGGGPLLQRDAHELSELHRAVDSGFDRVLQLYLSTRYCMTRFPLALVQTDPRWLRWLFVTGTDVFGLTPADVYAFALRRQELQRDCLWLTTSRNFTLSAKEAAALAESRRISWWRSLPARSLPRHAQAELRAATDAANTPRGPRARAHARGHASYGINVAGYFGYPAGVGQSARLLVDALRAVGIPYRTVCVPVPSQTHAGGAWWRSWHEPAYRTSVSVIGAAEWADVQGYLTPAFSFERRNIAYWVWETEDFPTEHAAVAAQFAEIWTPSHYCAAVLRRAVSVPVTVVPHAVSVPSHPGAPDRHPWSLPNDHVVFGFVFDLRSSMMRKNPLGVIAAFRQAFGRDDKATLVLKVNHANEYPDAMRHLRRAAEGLRVVFIDALLDKGALQALFLTFDVYVSLHRAEGFGLTLAEAMALGKPVVATAYSGNVDFMDNTCARLVDYTLAEAAYADGPYRRGSRWAEPQIEHAAACMRALYQDHDLRVTLGTAARQRIAETLSPERVGMQIKPLVPGASARTPAR